MIEDPFYLINLHYTHKKTTFSCKINPIKIASNDTHIYSRAVFIYHHDNCAYNSITIAATTTTTTIVNNSNCMWFCPSKR